jgi:alcohol dehydrogenase class IV
MNGEWRFFSAGEIIFGRGVVRHTGDSARQLGAERVLLITDPGLVSVGLHRPVEQSLIEASVTCDLYDGGGAKPTVDAVADCVAKAQGSSYDALVALGGGSNIDLAKAVAIVLRYGGAAGDYFGEHQVPGPMMPLIAISTTAGTGSEVSCAAVLADPANNRRGSILSNYVRPQVAVYDPLMTMSCPPVVTADAGIDALTHAVEAYMVVDHKTLTAGGEPAGVYQGGFPLSDILADKAISLVGRYLRRAVYKGGDVEAREGMHLASLLAGLAFSNAGLTAVHALEYPVGVATGGTHGAVNGLLLPYVMEYNIAACPERLATVARLLGEGVAGCSRWDAAGRSIQAVQRLKGDVGIPTRLRDLGIRESDLRPMAEATAQITRLLRANPRALDTESLEQILRNAW